MLTSILKRFTLLLEKNSFQVDGERTAHLFARDDRCIPINHAVFGKAAQSTVHRGSREVDPGAKFVLRELSVLLDLS